MPKRIVFLGPSLDRHEAEKILAAEYRPPAKRGDIAAAVGDGADVIVLIDGVFHQDNAVAHREILRAVKKGVKIVGASSMGALRAAEMDTLGMTGVGEIYRMYKSGELESDDEVALVFDPVSGMSLSEPLVNIRCTLRRALETGVIGQQAHDALLAAARSVFYPSRTYPAIVAEAAAAVDGETRDRFFAWVEQNACDQKREDAIAVLKYAKELADPEG
ncbi:MAG TPA: TfuA-related McrA-glycine thioamidation protein [Methanoregula sp.]|nr:TfuA-related McrA-glycine thioamidation protein [Methanoregula sp.]